MAESGYRTLDPLPERVKWVRLASGSQKDGLSIVECSHPFDMRKEVMRGARRVNLCGLCRGEDLTRSCLTLAMVPAKAREPGSPRKPDQEALF